MGAGTTDFLAVLGNMMGHSIVCITSAVTPSQDPVTKEAGPPHSAYTFHIYKVPRRLQMPSSDSSVLFLQIPGAIFMTLVEY